MRGARWPAAALPFEHVPCQSSNSQPSSNNKNLNHLQHVKEPAPGRNPVLVSKASTRRKIFTEPTVW